MKETSRLGFVNRLYYLTFLCIFPRQIFLFHIFFKYQNQRTKKHKMAEVICQLVFF